MNTFVDNVTKILKEQKITKNKLLSDLNLNRNSFVDWNKRGTIPSAKVVSAIAEYLGTTVGSLLGYSEDEEDLVSFPEKLSFQLSVSGKSIDDVAQYLHVSSDLVAHWLDGSNSSYHDYLDKLSDYFKVESRYWYSPDMISPGIEPSTSEYLLILLYRDYKKTGKLNDTYGRLEDYFPGIKIVYQDAISEKNSDLLYLFNRLPLEAQIEFKGELKGYLKRLDHEHVGELKEAK